MHDKAFFCFCFFTENSLKRKEKKIGYCKQWYLHLEPTPPRHFFCFFVFQRWVLKALIGMNYQSHCRFQTKSGRCLQVHQLPPWHHVALRPSRPRNRGHPDAQWKLKYRENQSKELIITYPAMCCCSLTCYCWSKAAPEQDQHQHASQSVWTLAWSVVSLPLILGRAPADSLSHWQRSEAPER